MKGSIILMVSAAAAKLLGAFFKIPLTNILGGVGMGYFSCAYSLFMPVYSLTVTGLSSAVARMTAQSTALGMYANTAKIRRTALGIFSLVGLIGSLLIILLAKPFSIYSTGSSEAAAAVAMIAPAVLFGCITAVERGCYEGMSNMYPTALSQVVEGVVKAAAGLLLCGYVLKNPQVIEKYFPYVTDVRAAAAAAGILGVTLSTLGAAVFLAAVRLFTKLPEGGESYVMSRKAIVRELAATAAPVGVSALVTNLTALIDMWTVIGCISCFGSSIAAPEGVSAAELPYFIYGSFAGIALTVFNLVPSVTNMLGKGALTCITSAYESKDRKALEYGTSQALLTAAVISVPAAVGIGVLAPEILGFLYPQQSDEAAFCVNSLRWLMAGMVCLCASYPLFSMLQAVGKSSAPLKITLIGTAVKLAGNLIFIPFMGVDGAALSTSLCYGTVLAISLKVYIKAADLHISAAPFGKVLYSGAMCGGAAYLTASLLKNAGASLIGVMGVSAAVGGAVYLVLIAALVGKVSIKRRERA
ncbi:polysaccharide biosynthesis C-terminal domain-containing protein [Ruminococcus sp.]|uniref:oligosaccharide flippase family protein n=1 Tax=Ruminococcus sp. TaxID=41978 RepID=UPI0025EB52DF|nr:polysaccharide biosynthesis C-terminal domain-containing protein [Ruminococcus sp.]